MRKIYLLIFISSVLAARSQSNHELDQFVKPILILERSFKAMGGDSLGNAKTLYLDYNGIKYMDGQSARSSGALSPLPWKNRVGFDFVKDRFYSESEDQYRGGYLFHFRMVYTDSSAFNFELPQLRFHNITDLPMAGKAGQKQGLLRSIPVYLLKMALEKKQTLRYAGEVQDKGVKYEIVSFAYSPNLTIDLWIDSKTDYLSRYQFFTDHAIHGNQLISYQFSDYRQVNHILFPYKRVYKANDIVQRVDSLATLQINAMIPETYFHKPDGYQKTVSSEMSLKEIGANIFMAENVYGYNPLFLDYGDHIVAIEAVNGSEDAIKLIKKRFPGKPIRQVVISHYHEDHSGGLPAFLKEGVGVLTTPGNMAYVSQFHTVQHNVLPVVSMPVPKVETISAVKEMNGGHLKMQIIPFFGNSHVDEMLVFYFPEEKILYQADLLISTDEGKISKPVLPVNRELYNFIKEHKLEVKMIYGVHLKAVSFEEFEKVLRFE